MSTLVDARPMRLIRAVVVHPKRRARSLYWHAIDMRTCRCATLHGHCRAVVCPCGRHEGEIAQ